MSRVLLVGDTHVYRHKQMPSRQEDCLSCLRWSIQVARDNNIKNLIHLGDIFHDKIRIHTLAYQSVFDILESAKDIEFTLLLGNHDMWYMDRRDISSIKPFGALPNVKIISEPQTIVYDNSPVDFAPYSRDPVAQLSSFKKKSKVLFGHLAVDNAILNVVKNTRSEVEIESDADMIQVTTKFFKGWERVFLGHYHGAQIIDGFVEYVGSNLQLTWNEASQQKHIIILDLETLNCQYVINNFSPKHLFVTPEEAKEIDLSNNFVCVEIDSIDKSDVMSMKAEILAKCHKPPAELDFVERNVNKVQEVVSAEQQKKFNLSSGETLERFVDSVGTSELDRELLLEIGRGIVGSES